MKNLPFNFLLITASALTFGCAHVGEDYQPPDTSDMVPATFSHPATGDNREGHKSVGNAVSSLWWEQLQNPQLNQAIGVALEKGWDIQVARERLLQSRALRSQTASLILPQASLAGSYVKNRNSENFLMPFTSGGGGGGLIPTEFDQWSLEAPLSWEVDIFGGGRRGMEAADARLEAAEVSVTATRLVTAAEVADAWYAITGLNARIRTLTSNIDYQSRIQSLVDKQFRNGMVTQLDVQRAATSVDELRSQLPPLEASRVDQLRRLTLLMGIGSGDLDDRIGSWSEFPDVLPFVNVGLPAELIRRRPDILKIERELAASNASIGEAIANFYPRFYLLGQPQLISSSAVNLFDSSSFAWQFAPRIEWEIFSSGRNKAILESARSRNREALINYGMTVTRAIGEVESSLALLTAMKSRHDALFSATMAARESVRLSTLRYDAGHSSLMDLLLDMSNQSRIESDLVQAQASTVRAWIRLHQALGGGFNPDP